MVGTYRPVMYQALKNQNQKTPLIRTKDLVLPTVPLRTSTPINDSCENPKINKLRLGPPPQRVWKSLRTDGCMVDKENGDDGMIMKVNGDVRLAFVHHRTAEGGRC